MRQAIFLAILLTTWSVLPAQADALNVSVAGPVNTSVNVGVAAPVAVGVAVPSMNLQATVAEPTFLQAVPTTTVSPTFLETTTATTAESTGVFAQRTTGNSSSNPANPTVTSSGAYGSATNSFAGTPLDSASQGTQSYTSYATGEGPQGEWHVQNLGDVTTKQLTGLNLNKTGTMGLAPVFGTSNDGLTSPGGYSPVITIPFLGTVRIPSTVGLPGGGMVGLPSSVTNPSSLMNTLTGN